MTLTSRPGKHSARAGQSSPSPGRVSSAHIGRAEAYFPQYDVLLLDGGQVAAGGWGVPIRWPDTISTLPDGYDGALISAVTGHETSVPADTLCIMAAAVRADRQGSGLAGQTLRTVPQYAEPKDGHWHV